MYGSILLLPNIFRVSMPKLNIHQHFLSFFPNTYLAPISSFFVSSFLSSFIFVFLFISLLIRVFFLHFIPFFHHLFICRLAGEKIPVINLHPATQKMPLISLLVSKHVTNGAVVFTVSPNVFCVAQTPSTYLSSSSIIDVIRNIIIMDIRSYVSYT